MTEPLFFDNDCLSAFLCVNEQSILPKLYPGCIVIPEPVCDELSYPQVNHLKERLDVMIANKQVIYMEIPLNSKLTQIILR